MGVDSLKRRLERIRANCRRLQVSLIRILILNNNNNDNRRIGQEHKLLLLLLLFSD